MEIERKYLVKQLPENLGKYPHFVIEQGYLWNQPFGSAEKITTTF